MSIQELRSLIHDKVNQTDNVNLLRFVSELFSIYEMNIKTGAGNSIEFVSGRQMDLILKSFSQSEAGDNLLIHQEVIKNIKNELRNTLD